MEPDPTTPASPVAELPKPGLLGGVGWCLVYLILVQVVLSILAILGYLSLLAITRPSAYRELIQSFANLSDIFSSPLGSQLLLVGMSAVPLGTLALCYWLLRQYAGPGWASEIGLTRVPSLSQLLLTLIALPAFMVLGEGTYQLAKTVIPSLAQLGNVPDTEQGLKATIQWPWWLAVLLIGVGPGVGEELFCRGFLGRGLVGRYGPVAGVAITSVLFGLLHVDPPHAVAAACMGLMLHVFYLLSRSLWLPILLHTINNSLSALTLPGREWTVPGMAELELAQQTWPVLFYTTASGLLLAVLWAMRQTASVPATEAAANTAAAVNAISAQSHASTRPTVANRHTASRANWAVFVVFIWLAGFIATVGFAQFNRG